MTDKIYSVKASRPSARIGGWRVKAPNMQDATRQVQEELNHHGSGWDVSISELANQAAAMRKWEKDHAGGDG